ncbi:MAG: TolB-like translocation protein [Anaerolineae bacterium]
MLKRPDLLDQNSPENLEVIQLTLEPAVPSAHIYMEAQIFTPDSQKLLLHRSCFPHGSDKNDPNHQYLLCDLADNCRLNPVTSEIGATAPSLSPDGKIIYYFVDETRLNGGRLTLKKVNLDGSERRTLMVLDTPLPGFSANITQVYPLSTISSDGQRLAISGFLGDGIKQGAPYGLFVFDLLKNEVNAILAGETWCNIHPQYCRSTEPGASHDILLQENHGCVYNPEGEITTLVGGLGADLHVICDDGSNFRDLPFGRDRDENCQGHECWRGMSTEVISSTIIFSTGEQQLVEGAAAPGCGHLGLHTPGARRNVLSRSFADAHFWHFGVDKTGDHVVSDAGGFGTSQAIYWAQLMGPNEPAARWQYLLTPRSHSDLGIHLHPFLSPDGLKAFFNSDESGVMQAYMLTGLPE